MFEIKKDLSDHYTKKHESTITSNMKCVYGKCTADEVCDDCLDEWLPNKNENNE